MRSRQLRGFKPDVVVVAAYGLILPKAILDVPPKGCLNLHASLLPRWRGAAPIQRAIMAGDLETGVMVMRMEEGLDTGPVALTERIAIGPDANAGEISERLALAGADLMARALAMLEAARSSLRRRPRTASPMRIRSTRPKRGSIGQNQRRICTISSGLWRRSRAPFSKPILARALERVKVLRTEISKGAGAPGRVLDAHLTIACGQGALRLLEVQRPGRAPMPAADFLRGARLGEGTLLASKTDAAL